MFPCFKMHDVTNRCLGNTKMTSEFVLSYTSFALLSYAFDLFYCQCSHTVMLTFGLIASFFMEHVLHVFFMSSFEKMRGIYTCWFVTSMTTFGVWLITIMKKVCKTVYQEHPTFTLKFPVGNPVSCFISMTEPQPTFIWRRIFNHGKQSVEITLGEWWNIFSHLINMTLTQVRFKVVG